MRGIVFAGNLIVDHIKCIEALPPRGELAKILHVYRSTGGCVCNTGIDLAILDPELAIGAVGVVGRDADGDRRPQGRARGSSASCRAETGCGRRAS